jgi:ribosomal protein S18 acetylase RimI-like enzyme
MAIVIRDANVQAFDDIASLAVAAYEEYAHALTPENWTTMRTNLSQVAVLAKQGQLVVAQQDSTLVGFVVYCPPGTSDRRLFPPEWASLRMLAVSPQQRGQGIGRQLSLACVHRAKHDRADVVGLHTSELMVAARRMYERIGFQQECELPRSLGIRYWRYALRLADDDWADCNLAE